MWPFLCLLQCYKQQQQQFLKKTKIDVVYSVCEKSSSLHRYSIRMEKGMNWWSLSPNMLPFKTLPFAHKHIEYWQFTFTFTSDELFTSSVPHSQWVWFWFLLFHFVVCLSPRKSVYNFAWPSRICIMSTLYLRSLMYGMCTGGDRVWVRSIDLSFIHWYTSDMLYSVYVCVLVCMYDREKELLNLH